MNYNNLVDKLKEDISKEFIFTNFKSNNDMTITIEFFDRFNVYIDIGSWIHRIGGYTNFYDLLLREVKLAIKIEWNKFILVDKEE